MYASGETISARVVMQPLGEGKNSKNWFRYFLNMVVMQPLEEGKTRDDIGAILGTQGFTRVLSGDATSWEQVAYHEPTQTYLKRVVSHAGNGHYKGFVRIEGSDITAIRANPELGETPDERQRAYLEQRLNGFVDQVLSNYFEIQDRDS